MPRASRLPPKLITATSTFRKPTPVPHAPRLWNAKRRIPVSVGLKRKDLSRINDNPHIFFQRALRFAGPSTSEASKIQDRYLKFKAAEPPENLEWWQQDSSRVLQFMENHPLYSKLSSDVRTFTVCHRGSQVLAPSSHLRSHLHALPVTSPLAFHITPTTLSYTLCHHQQNFRSPFTNISTSPAR